MFARNWNSFGFLLGRSSPLVFKRYVIQVSIQCAINYRHHHADLGARQVLLKKSSTCVFPPTMTYMFPSSKN